MQPILSSISCSYNTLKVRANFITQPRRSYANANYRSPTRHADAGVPTKSSHHLFSPPLHLQCRRGYFFCLDICGTIRKSQYRIDARLMGTIIIAKTHTCMYQVAIGMKVVKRKKHVNQSEFQNILGQFARRKQCLKIR